MIVLKYFFIECKGVNMKITCGIALINHKNQILVGHVTKQPYNIWSIPKGLIKKKETYKQTALREFKEETNIDLSSMNLNKIGEYSYNKKKVLIGFYARLPKELYIDVFEFKCYSMVNRYEIPFPEIDAFTWLDIKDIHILHHTQQELIKDIYKRYYNKN
jgi:8-oxo-dGTP pyrophosphatase MutT (NUDIX family)